ncbi:MAG: replicative DNA helicase [Bdellovibrionota bacterium]
MALEIVGGKPKRGGGNGGGRDRTPMAFKIGDRPHDLDTEKALLASVLLSNDCLLEIQGVFQVEMMFLPAHQVIFEGMRGLSFKGIPVELTTLANHLKENGLLERIGGVEYLAEISQSPATALHAMEYAKFLRDLAWRRKLIEAGELCRGLALKAGETNDIAAEIEKTIFEATQEKKNSSMERIGSLLTQTLKDLEFRSDNQGALDVGSKTGLRDLDECLLGMRPGQLLVLAARPGMGKTSLASNIMVHTAMKQKKAVLFMSLEMTKEEVCERMISFVSGVDLHKIKTGKLSAEDFEEIFFAAEQCEEAPLYVDDRSVITPYDVLAEARKVKSMLQMEGKGTELGLVVVDYIQIMKSGGFAENRSLEVGQITGGLKAIAKDLKVPVLALSQLNREVARRGTEIKKPQLSDLKDSGAIEADADVVMFIHREQSPDTDSRAPSEAEIIVAKHRAGPTKAIRVVWLGHLTKFSDATTTSYLPPHIPDGPG